MKRFILTATQSRRLQARVINLAVMSPGEIVEIAPRSFFRSVAQAKGAQGGCAQPDQVAHKLPDCREAEPRMVIDASGHAVACHLRASA